MNYNYCFYLFKSGSKYKSTQGQVRCCLPLLIYFLKKNICREQDFYFTLKLEEDPVEFINRKLNLKLNIIYYINYN